MIYGQCLRYLLSFTGTTDHLTSAPITVQKNLIKYKEALDLFYT